MKLLLLDCDGTIREPKSGGQFISSPHDQRIITGAAEIIRQYHLNGYLVVGITNQGGCAASDPQTGKPYKSLEEAIAEQAYTLKLCQDIAYILFCPDFEGKVLWEVGIGIDGEIEAQKPDAKDFDSFRKPGAGMLQYAMVMAKVKREDCLFVGDRLEDQQASAAAGIRFMWAADWLKGGNNDLSN